ncbi:hypothetical protein GVAV_001972 [Gurleya vavrai]
MPNAYMDKFSNDQVKIVNPTNSDIQNSSSDLINLDFIKGSPYDGITKRNKDDRNNSGDVPSNNLQINEDEILDQRLDPIVQSINFIDTFENLLTEFITIHEISDSSTTNLEIFKNQKEHENIQDENNLTENNEPKVSEKIVEKIEKFIEEKLSQASDDINMEENDQTPPLSEFDSKRGTKRKSADKNLEKKVKKTKLKNNNPDIDFTQTNMSVNSCNINVASKESAILKNVNTNDNSEFSKSKNKNKLSLENFKNEISVDRLKNYCLNSNLIECDNKKIVNYIKYHKILLDFDNKNSNKPYSCKINRNLELYLLKIPCEPQKSLKDYQLYTHNEDYSNLSFKKLVLDLFCKDYSENNIKLKERYLFFAFTIPRLVSFSDFFAKNFVFSNRNCIIDISSNSNELRPFEISSLHFRRIIFCDIQEVLLKIDNIIESNKNLISFKEHCDLTAYKIKLKNNKELMKCLLVIENCFNAIFFYLYKDQKICDVFRNINHPYLNLSEIGCLNEISEKSIYFQINFFFLIPNFFNEKTHFHNFFCICEVENCPANNHDIFLQRADENLREYSLLKDKIKEKEFKLMLNQN